MKTAANIEAVRKLCERWAWLSEKEFALKIFAGDHTRMLLHEDVRSGAVS